MSQQLQRQLPSSLRAQQSLGPTCTTVCWSPLTEREHRIICTTTDVLSAVPPHMHPRHHLGVVERGTAMLQSEGRHWTVGAGDLIWHAPRQMHSMFSECCRCRWIAVDEDIVERISVACGAGAPERTRVYAGGSRAAELVELHHCLERGAVTSNADSTLANLIAGLAEAPAKAGERSPLLTPNVERCRIAIRNGYAASIRLADLARIAHLSLFHLARTFASVLGVPPHTYLMHLRVAWTQTLLERGMAGSRAAYDVGFADQSHCIRVHRKLLGMSPFAVRALERGLPLMADGFARLPTSTMRAAASIWRP